VASAALRELLNGPAEGNAAGAQTALPTLAEIVTYGGRGPDWGYEVRLIKLTIADGVATANFSKELRAYGGGATRVGMIREQIERTLRQFSSVSSVVIQIEGQSAGELQP
jgi:spore germination protein GerM